MIDKMIKNAIYAVLSIGLTHTGIAAASSAQSEMEPMNGMEKCYGIAKMGQNDCATTQHACAGEAQNNNLTDEWIGLPTGLCMKIVGGNLNTKG